MSFVFYLRLIILLQDCKPFNMEISKYHPFGLLIYIYIVKMPLFLVDRNCGSHGLKI